MTYSTIATHLRRNNVTRIAMLLAFLIVSLKSSSQNYSVIFDGDDNLTTPANSSAILNGDNTWTMEFWVKLPTNTGTPISLATSATDYILFHSAGTIAFYNQSGTIQCANSSFPLDGSWFHFAVASNGPNNAQFYINGSLVPASTSNLHTGFVNLDTESFTIGSGAGLSNFQIDEFRIWSDFRDASTVASLMNSELVGNEIGLIAYYNFNEGFGSVVNDLSVNTNDGNLTGTPVWSTDAPFAEPTITQAIWEDSDMDNQIDQVWLTIDHDIYNIEVNDLGGVADGFPGIEIYYNGTPVVIDNADYSLNESPADLTLTFLGDQIPSTSIDLVTLIYTQGTDGTIKADGTIEMLEGAVPDIMDEWVEPVIVSVIPSDDASNVTLGTSTLSMAFTEDVQLNGTGFITLHNLTNPPNSQALSVTNPAQVSVSGNTVTLTPFSALEAGSEYYVEVPDNTITDLMINAYPGLVTSSDWNFTMETEPNSVLTFDGSTNYVDLFEDDLFTGDFTLEAWVNIANFSDYSPIISKQATTDNSTAEFNLQVQGPINGNINFFLGTGSGISNVSGNNTDDQDITLSTWTHVAAVVEGTNMLLYINGQLSGTSTFTGTRQNSSSPVQLGHYLNASEQFWPGQIDEVRIWNHARGATDIQANFSNQLTGGELGLVAYYDFSDGTGTTLTDQTGSNDGTINGEASWSTSGPTVDPAPAVNLYNLLITPGITEATIDNITLSTISELSYVITTSSIRPTADQIINGQDHTGSTAYHYYTYGGMSGDNGVTIGNSAYTNGSDLLAGTTYYVYWVADVDGSSATTNDQSVILSQEFTTVLPADLTFTTLSVPPTNVAEGSNDNIIYGWQMDVATSDVESQGYLFDLIGSFDSADFAISGFKLWENTTNDFGTASVVGSSSSIDTANNPGGAMIALLYNQTYTTGTTTYFWVTADMAAGATPSNTFSVVEPETSAFNTFNFSDQFNYFGSGVTTGNTMTIGSPNYALDFDGADDYIQVNQTFGSAYTIELWVNSANVANRTIFRYTTSSDPTNAFSHRLDINAGVFKHYTNDGGLVQVVSTTSLVSDTWYHVAISAEDDGFAHIYVNGVEEGTPAATGTLYRAGNEIRIGQGMGASPSYFDGEIDEVRVWNTLRTASDIAANANNELTGGEAGLVIYYDFSDGTGTTLTDQAGANDATINGAASWSTSGPTLDSAPAVNLYNLYITPGITDATIDNISLSALSELSYVITTSSIHPSVDQIINGQDHTGSTAYNYYTYGSMTGDNSVTIGNSSFTNGSDLVAGTNYYVYWVADVDGSSATTNDQSVILSQEFTTVLPADLTFTTLSIPATNVAPGSTDNVIYGWQMDVATSDVESQGYLFDLMGTFDSADFALNGFQLWENTTNNFATASTVGSISSIDTANNPGGAMIALIYNQTYTSGTTTYFWVTADMAPGATAGNSFSVVEPETSAFNSFNFSDVFNWIGSGVTAGSVMTVGTQNTSVTTTTPGQLENNVVASNDIIIDFDATLDAASLNAATIKVWGSQSGLATATYSGGGTSSLTINPDNDFLAGENVSVVITSGVQGTGGEIANPYMLSFKVATGAFKGSFVNTSTALEGVVDGSAAWADYDGDGDLDVVVSGWDFEYGSVITKIFNNSGGAVFTDIGASLIAAYEGSVTWGDYDNDGDLDLFLTGFGDIESAPIAKLYRNDAGTFNDAGETFQGVYYSEADWGDYDNDGDLDLVVQGRNTSSGPNSTNIYRNDAGSFININAGLIGVYQGGIQWGDYDNDGDLDIVSSGNDGTSRLATIYNNDGGTFTDISAALAGRTHGKVVWGDYDNDGDLDLVVSGFDGTTNEPIIYRNDAGSFVNINAGLLENAEGEVTWGDYDGDGDLDLLINGSGVSDATTTLYDNNAGSFTDSGITLENYFYSTVDFGDYDGDGDLDILLTGDNDYNGGKVSLFTNEIAPPAAPTNLVGFYRDATSIELAWTDVATDNTDYLVEWSTSYESFDANIVSSNVIGAASAVGAVVGVGLNQGYFFRVTATNGYEDASSQSVIEFATTEGFPGHALSFDGIDDYVTVTNSNLPSGNTSFTFETWIKRGAQTGDRWIAWWGAPTPAADQTLIIGYAGATGLIKLHRLSGNDAAASTATIPLDEWTHLGIVYHGNNLSDIYLNGSYVETIDNNVALNTPLNPTFQLGTFDSNNAYVIDAELDETKIWIDSVKTNFSDRFYAPIGNELKLGVYYSMDENGGATVVDQSVHTNDGAITGATFVSSEAGLPIIYNATNATIAGFTPNIEIPAGAIDMIVDVSTDPSFGSFLPSGQDISIGTSGGIDVSVSLNTTSQYYYRVKADFGGTQSGYAVSNSFMVSPGYAFNFPGNSKYVTITDSNELDLNGDATIEFWANWNGFDEGSHAIISKSVDSNSRNYSIYINAEGALIIHGVNENVTGFGFTELVWTHIAIVQSGTDFLLYVNGELVETISDTWDSANSSELWIGADYVNSEWDGLLDEIRIWNYARSAVEISEFAEKTVSGSDPGLMAYYKFDEVSGTSLPDLSLYGNHGVFQNSTGSEWVPSNALAIPLTVEISSNGLLSDPSSESALSISIDFNREVASLTSGSFTVSNANISNISTSDNISFTADISPISTGQVQVFLDSDVVQDLNGTFNVASNVLEYNYSETASYTISVPSYGYEILSSPTALSEVLDDDASSSAQAIGFDFVFFGETYSSVYVNSNGWVSFLETSDPSAYSGEKLPDPVGIEAAANGLIAGYWSDLDGGSAPADGYQVELIGTAPNRIYVIQYKDVPHLNNASNLVNFQIKLFEGTNEVEIHCESCYTSDEQFTQGLENHDGTDYITVLGRNQSVFSIYNDAVKFTPVTPGGEVIESFETASGGGSYYDMPTGGYHAANTYPDGIANSGSVGMRLSYGNGTLVTPLIDGNADFSFWAAGTGTGEAHFTIEKSVEGAPYVVVATPTVTSTSFVQQTVTLSEGAGTAVRIRITLDDLTSDMELMVDDITFTEYSGVATFPPQITGLSSLPASTDAFVSLTVDLNTEVYFVVSASATVPSTSQISSGLDGDNNPALVTDSSSYGGLTGHNNLFIDGLTPGGTYYIHLYGAETFDLANTTPVFTESFTTEIIPIVTISTESVAGGELISGSIDNLLYKMRMDVSDADANMIGFVLFPNDSSGNYSQSDFIQFNFYESINADELVGATYLGSSFFANSNPELPDGSVGYLWNNTYSADDVVYLYVTADMAGTVTEGASFNFEQPDTESNFGFDDSGVEVIKVDGGLSVGSSFTMTNSGGSGVVTGSATINSSEGFDLSVQQVAGLEDDAEYLPDFVFVSNEGVNFGNEGSTSLSSTGARILRLTTYGSIDTVTTVPIHTGSAPWVTVSWDFTNGTGGLPIAVGELWAIYTREGNYAVIEITDVPDPMGTEFSFSYKYQPDGGNSFEEEAESLTVYFYEDGTTQINNTTITGYVSAPDATVEISLDYGSLTSVPVDGGSWSYDLSSDPGYYGDAYYDVQIVATDLSLNEAYYNGWITLTTVEVVFEDFETMDATSYNGTTTLPSGDWEFVGAIGSNNHPFSGAVSMGLLDENTASATSPPIDAEFPFSFRYYSNGTEFTILQSIDEGVYEEIEVINESSGVYQYYEYNPYYTGSSVRYLIQIDDVNATDTLFIDDFTFVEYNTDPKVFVYSPYGGEEVSLDYEYYLYWGEQNIDPSDVVTVSLSLDGGSSYPYTLVSDLSGNLNGEFYWTPTGNELLTNDAVIEISVAGVSATSELFSIVDGYSGVNSLYETFDTGLKDTEESSITLESGTWNAQGVISAASIDPNYPLYTEGDAVYMNAGDGNFLETPYVYGATEFVFNHRAVSGGITGFLFDIYISMDDGATFDSLEVSGVGGTLTDYQEFYHSFSEPYNGPIRIVRNSSGDDYGLIDEFSTDGILGAEFDYEVEDFESVELTSYNGLTTLPTGDWEFTDAYGNDGPNYSGAYSMGLTVGTGTMITPHLIGGTDVYFQFYSTDTYFSVYEQQNEGAFNLVTSYDANAGTYEEFYLTTSETDSVRLMIVAESGAANLIIDDFQFAPVPSFVDTKTVVESSTFYSNDKVSITFSDGVFSTAGLSGVLDDGDFIVSTKPNDLIPSISSVTMTEGDAMVTIFLTYENSPNGLDSLDISFAPNSIFNSNGDLVQDSTIAFKLQDAVPPVITVNTNEGHINNTLLTGSVDDETADVLIMLSSISRTSLPATIIGNSWSFDLGSHSDWSPINSDSIYVDFEVSAYDSMGNSTTVAYPLIFDTSAPGIPTVDGKTVSGNSYTLTGSYDEIDTDFLRISIDNGANWDTLSITGGTWSAANSGLADGIYKVTLEASDSAGNVTTDQSNAELLIDSGPINSGDYAIDFGGGSEQINVNGNPLHGLSTFTIEFEFNSSMIPGNNFNVFQFDGEIDFMMLGSGPEDVQLFGAFGNYEVYNANPNDSVWHHFAIVSNGGGSNVTAYLDGVPLTLGTTSFLNFGGSGDLILGYLSPEGVLLDEFRIWSVARSETEILSSMDSVDAATAGLELYYSFNDGPGNVIVSDLSGNGYNGVLTNMDQATDWVLNEEETDTVPPTIVGQVIVSVAENVTAVETYDAGETVIWTLSGDDSSLFSIGVDGSLTFNTAPDFEAPSDNGNNNIYDIYVVAIDSVNNADSIPVSISVYDENDNAPIITDPGAITIAENSLVGSSVHAFGFTDVDTVTVSYSWSIISGNTDINGDLNVPFEITSAGLLLVKDSADLDFELVNSFNLEIAISDGLFGDTLFLNVSLNDVIEDEEAPVITANDLLTNDVSPELTGTVDDVTATLSIIVDGTTYSGINAGDGTWSLAQGIISNLVEGTYLYEAIAIDLLGNSDTVNATLIIDLTAPVVSANAIETNDASPAFSGSIDDVEAGISLIVDGSTYSGINNGDGTWSLVQGSISDLAEGSYLYEVIGLDSAGNADTVEASLVIDLTAPIISGVDLLTNEISPELSGSLDDVTATVTITVDGADYSGINNGDGTWSLAQGTIADLSEGTYSVRAIAVDVVSNADTVDFNLTVDLTAPIISGVDLLTNEISPELSGSLDDVTATVTITVDGADYSGTNNGDGTWSLAQGTIADLSEGTYSVRAIAVDVVSNADTVDFNLTVDLTAPIISGVDLLTNDISPELSGSLDDATATVTITVDGTDYSGTNNGDGTWSLAQGTIADLSEGTYSVRAIAVDGVSNADTVDFNLTVDLTAPIISGVDLLTNEISPELSGSLDDATAAVTITVDGADYSGINNGDGTWSLAQGTIADLSEGTYSVMVVGADAASNADTVLFDLTVDITAPLITVNVVETEEESPELSGTIDDNTAAIEILVDGITYNPTNNGDGTWTLAQGTITGLAIGTYEVDASATDEAGNTGIDNTNSELSIIAGIPVALEATDVDYFNFTANWMTSAGAVNYKIDVATDITFVNRVTGFNNLTVAGTSIPVTGLDYNTTYYYRVRVEYGSGDVSVNSNVIAVKTLSDPATLLDSMALLTIYEQLGGSEWTNNNWTPGVDLRNWTGVTMTGTRVTGIVLSSNKLSGTFPSISSGLEQLTTLNLSNNEITAFGNISNLTALVNLDVSNNRLQFGSIEPLVTQVTSCVYTPQKTVLARLRSLEEIGSTYKVDRTLTGSANQYSWTKNGTSFAQSAASFVVTINDFTVDGSYVASVTNTEVPGLTLITAPVVLRVSSLERDSTSLLAVYDSLNGSNSSVSDWPNLPIAQWDEVVINNSRVTNIDLSSKGLSGSIPEDILDIKSLLIADFSNNNIDGLTNLSGSLPNLTNFDVTGNKLTFEDLEVNAGVSALDYSTQQLIGSASSEVLPVGSSYTLGVSVGGSSNTYSWTLANDLDTAVVANLTTSEVAIESLSYETMGIYTLKVTSSLVPGLTLQSEEMQILASANLEFTALDLGDEAFTSGEGFAIKVVPGEEFDTIQTIRGAGNGFEFNDLILGDYLIAVAPDNLLEFLPTYFENTDLWTQADTLELRADFSDTLRMAQIPGATSGDIGISGTVTRDDGNGGRINARRKVKRAGCSVRRFVPKGRVGQDDEEGTYELYAYVQSDDEGRFEFKNLEAGRYRFNIEYPGIPMDEDSYVEFVIGEGGIEEEVLILEATITDDGIIVEKIERLGFYRKYFKDLNVYPNPADNIVNVSYSKLMSETVKVRLIDLEGNVITEQLIEKGYDKELQLDVSGVSGGIYLINFIDTSDGSSRITSFKVYVKH